MGFVRLYLRVEEEWFRLPQKMRYVLVGGFNSVAAYAVFAALFLWLRSYVAAIVLQYAISINLSVMTMGRYVFRARGPFVERWRRAVAVYASLLPVNYASLFLMVDVAEIRATIAQGIYVAAESAAVYFLHKYFSFGR